MIRKLIFTLFLIVWIVNIYSLDYSFTPGFSLENFVEYQQRDYTNNGVGHTLTVAKISYTQKIREHHYFTITRNEFDSDEDNLKYISSANEFRYTQKKGRNDFMIYLLKNEKDNFYDSLIFYYRNFGFGANFGGGEDVETSFARYGNFDYTLLKNKLKTGSQLADLDPDDFIPKFFVIYNIEFPVYKNINMAFEYNGDTNIYSLNYKQENFKIEYSHIEGGDYMRLAGELGKIQQEKDFIRFVFYKK
ncbi:MAG: hypothetical protein C0601_09245 [Candidatus Muiribacterium halophilum]|uniref:Uncharacterized protein n=1 Tax=Muiribacterium halophilum TaxID=2053465 RepID=A0A2N5ZDS0_MUIH1|nr:MAG: hypothetical protein C0601_09245 [Candidatus Muirbacterium halophilum]